MWALGRFWTIEVWVIPGASRVRRGPYRFLSNPNYLIVVLELFMYPWLAGAPLTAVLGSLLHVGVLARRLGDEREALALLKG